MERKKEGDGYLIAQKLYLGEDIHKKLITLTTKKGDIMKYGKDSGRTVSFPGEYDVKGTSITCYEAEDLLHFVVRLDGAQRAIIQDKAVFDVANFESIDGWIVTDESIKTEIETQELDGDVIVLC